MWEYNGRRQGMVYTLSPWMSPALTGNALQIETLGHTIMSPHLTVRLLRCLKRATFMGK